MFVDKDIQFIPGVGPKRSELLRKELNIETKEDLLYYFPYKYIDNSRIFKIRELTNQMPHVQLKGRFASFQKKGEGRNARYTAVFYDDTGRIELVWFRGYKYLIGKYSTEKDYLVHGKPSYFNGYYNIVHPEIEDYTPNNEKRIVGLQSFYNTTERMKSAFLTSKNLQKIIYSLVLELAPLSVEESLPAYLVQHFHFLSKKEALINIHFPTQANMLKKAQERLKFEELFYIQLSILRKNVWRKNTLKGFVFETIGEHFNQFYHDYLPFSLTGAQKRVLKEIRQDVKSGKLMNRLVQGDVGSGKTLVALMAMLMAVDNGFQTCLMAPTEILANQHFQTFISLLGEMNINIALLTGSSKKKEREEIHENLLNGNLHILIGTHALIEDTVQFKNLALVIIDEQHRFGVEQRAKLWKKNTLPPHVLVMTATPIPRTLAMTVYGDLEVSVIDELPPGRKPIQTYHYFDNRRNSLNEFLRKEVEKGRQIYIVYPLIQESEKIDLKNLEDGFEYMKNVFPEFTISMVHGKMKNVEKDEEMQKFVSGETQIMLATTVIEVGVNVPNASVMVIENAERFGLAQLHQLRGRVGRGAEQSFCLLISSYKISKETRKRLEIMTQTNDGFEIAEADLKMRGPGDMDGIRQSGLPFELKIANLIKDANMLQLARDTVLSILEKDPNLSSKEHSVLRRELRKKEAKNEGVNWSLIS